MKTRLQTRCDSEWIAYAERILADLEAPFQPPATGYRVFRGEGPDTLLQLIEFSPCCSTCRETVNPLTESRGTQCLRPSKFRSKR